MHGNLNLRLQKIMNIIVCPYCDNDLTYQQNSAFCNVCNNTYKINKGKIYFISLPEYNDPLDDLKGKLKRLLGKYYYSLGVNIIAPTYPFNYLREIRKRSSTNNAIVVDLGCGNHRIDDNIICIDIFDYDAVDIVCDLENLPFRKGSVDVFASRSVIEHIPNPSAVIKKIYECTREGGYGLHLVPFLFPFHASPHDFQRYTHRGLDHLFHAFKKVEQRNIAGPISMMLANIIEFISILLSCGNQKLQANLYLLCCLFFFPFKYLDWFFIHSTRYYSLSASFLMVVQKKEIECFTNKGR
jgi:SAM-dependent methyltransferase